jgi:hypothetical protein
LPFTSGQFYVAQCDSYLSEQTCLFLSSGRALPSTGRDGATLAEPTQHVLTCARSWLLHLSDSEPIYQRSGRCLFLPVTTAGTARGLDIPIKKRFVPTA